MLHGRPKCVARWRYPNNYVNTLSINTVPDANSTINKGTALINQSRCCNITSQVKANLLKKDAADDKLRDVTNIVLS
jgi:hypothetical protein